MNESWIKKVDPYVAIPAIIVLSLLLGWAIIDPNGMGESVGIWYVFITQGFGWAYTLLGVVFIIFCLWLAFGPYGNVKLGKETDKPEHSFFSWFSMIIACGYGVGLVFWGVAEPLTFYNNPPGSIEAGTAEAATRAISQAFFHWGWTPWAIYMTVGITIGYFMFRKNIPPFFSRLLEPIVGKRCRGKAFRILDGFLVFGVIGGISTSTGLGIMQLASGLNNLFGIPINNTTYLIIAAAWCALFTTSAVSGIDKGIKILSNINIPLAIIICVVVFLLCPMAFILNITSEAMGDMLSNFFTMSLWTDPVSGSGFPQDWTIFYWAWWIACAPSTGLFIADISKGRTFKEIVVMHLCAAPIATWLWFGTFGGTALFKDIFQNAGIANSMAANGTESAIFAFFNTMPLGNILSFAFLILIFLFLATTVDSFAYVCAQTATKEFSNPRNPSKPLRAFWAVSIGALSITMIFIGQSQIKSLQLTSILASIVILIYMVLVMIAMIKQLKQEEIEGTLDLDYINKLARVGWDTRRLKTPPPILNEDPKDPPTVPLT
ncbi:MAG: BCCT family transporter [Eubacteriaceae bacterium]